jgi:hypothetical protein
MTTITLEVPDELAAQFKIAPAALSALIREAVAAKAARLSPRNQEEESAQPVFQEIIDLLASGPTADRLIRFKLSDTAQERLEDLLDRNREDELTTEERVDNSQQPAIQRTLL